MSELPEHSTPVRRKNVRQRLLPFLAFIILPCTALPNVPKNMMPYISGKDLNGTPCSVPKGLSAERTLVLLGFDEPQQEAIDTWTQGLGLDQPTNTIPWVEMPLIENPGMFMRWFIDTGMRGGIKGRFQRSHVWTAYTDKKAFLQSCGITSENEIQVLVVDRTGTILHSESGAYTKECAAKLLTALREPKTLKSRQQ
jgi:hypothetical protein